MTTTKKDVCYLTTLFKYQDWLVSRWLTVSMGNCGINLNRQTAVHGDKFFQCKFFHHKSYMDWPEVSPESPR
jgi:hypothetical protein